MLNICPKYAQYIPAMSIKDMTKYPPDMPKICLRYGPNMHNMNQLQMFQKVGYGGGPIFKVVLSVNRGVLNRVVELESLKVRKCLKVG